MVISRPAARASIPYDVPLQPDGGRDNWARLVLPADLTAAEAERVCGVVRAVAISHDR